jgi:uncharacterized UBP type Zn finger protein
MDDKSQLLAMGFTEKLVVKALKLNGSLQNAMDWLLANPNDDGNLDEKQQEEEEVQTETASSLKCDECGKLLKDGILFG